MPRERVWLCLVDETNRDPSEVVTFYVTGALIVPFDLLGKLHEKVEGIRARHGYLAGDQLKWDTHSRPGHVSPEDFRRTKFELIDLAKRERLSFAVCLTLHALAQGRNEQIRVEFAVNRLLTSFDIFLGAHSASGVALLDRLPTSGENRFLRENFAGRRNSQTGQFWRAERVRLLGLTCDGASHVSSILDVMLGGFASCLNDRRTQSRPRVLEIMRALAPTLPVVRIPDGPLMFDPRGFLMNPETRRVPIFETAYRSAESHLLGLVRESGARRR